MNSPLNHLNDEFLTIKLFDKKKKKNHVKESLIINFENKIIKNDR